ncbi:type II toxin-antitoxin system VapB family antitoxin [Wenzhouxiangella limi]|uniref:Type II toxin-antitoxin system VapB family antitoxin n=1 Tax=Wenzhouxiangella limi TaxID=2707351 RepID=A0A845UXT2_9GAMM|nr:type II toxin-antitoxin system VapB family antitoxin [Wenzhouxiangella limi]NDY95314.1 type II toxin-antitoxin system VapB family antitoxin [Wenzhouxiangella limi]
MPLSIKDEETDRLARELAAESGLKITEAVKLALRSQLELERAQRSRMALPQKLLNIGRRCAENLPEAARSDDHAELLYDELGLPK